MSIWTQNWKLYMCVCDIILQVFNACRTINVFAYVDDFMIKAEESRADEDFIQTISD